MKFVGLCNGKIIYCLLLNTSQKRDLGKITRLVSYYELKDATTTFELALWKSKLDQVGANNSTNRAAYRIDVPGPGKDMLQYLDHI